MSHNDLWIAWGKYSNEAEIRAARNYFKVRLGFPGSHLRSVHPVPRGRLNVLNHEGQRILRQHLEHTLRQDLQDESMEAVEETLLNLNTIANERLNERRVRISTEMDSEDGTEIFEGRHHTRDDISDLEDLPPSRTYITTLPNHDDRAPMSGSRPSSNSYAKYESGHQQGESNPTRDTRSRDEDAYEQGGSSYTDSTIRIRRSHSILRRVTPDQRSPHSAQYPGSPSSSRLHERSSRSDDHAPDDSRVRRPEKDYEERLSRDFENALNLDQQDRNSRKRSVQRAERDHVSHDHGDRRHHDGYNDERYNHSREERSPRPFEYRTLSRKNSPRLDSVDTYSSYEHTYEPGYSPRYARWYPSKGCRDDEHVYRRSDRRQSRHEPEERPRSNGTRDPEENHDDEEAYHRSLGRYREPEPYEHRKHSREPRPELHSRDSHKESTFGPFSPESIFSVIQKGERVDFFNALYELHPEHAPRDHSVTLMRKSWLSWKYMPLIVQLLRKGSVREIEEVFAKSNMDDLFRALKGEISGRRKLW